MFLVSIHSFWVHRMIECVPNMVRHATSFTMTVCGVETTVFTRSFTHYFEIGFSKLPLLLQELDSLIPKYVLVLLYKAGMELY